MTDDDGKVVQLDPERAKQQKRYDKLKAAKPTPGSDDWKELMLLGRRLSPNKSGRAAVKATRDAAKQEKLAELYPRALLVIEKQLADFLEDHIIVCEECGHGTKTHRGKDPTTALKAAMRVVDQHEGKAAQTIRTEETTVHEIRYVTAAAPDEEAG